MMKKLISIIIFLAAFQYSYVEVFSNSYETQGFYSYQGPVWQLQAVDDSFYKANIAHRVSYSIPMLYSVY